MDGTRPSKPGFVRAGDAWRPNRKATTGNSHAAESTVAQGQGVGLQRQLLNQVEDNIIMRTGIQG